MFKKWWIWAFMLSAILMAQGAMAFPCFITVFKDSCWTNYTVKVDVLDDEAKNIITTIVIPKGDSWSRGRIEAKSKQIFMLRAKFEPAIWEGDKDKLYYAKRYSVLPEKIEGDTKAWHVGVCYPKNFVGVPLPPGAGSQCLCPEQKDMPDENDL